MAGTWFSAGESPHSHEDSLSATQEWELLTVSTMSASALLANGHGLGFGLPPRSTPGLQTSRIDDDRASRRDGDSDAERSSIFRSSLPLDVSQIAVICTSSTPSVEPFTEGWNPQFRIAGAPLQEDYYAPDPFASVLSNTNRSLEPFLDMEQSFLKEPSMSVDDQPFLKRKKSSCSPENTGAHGKGVEFQKQQEINADNLFAHEEGMKTISSNSDLSDPSKASTRKTLTAQEKCLQPKRKGFFHRKSYVVWSVALTTALLGVILITYRSYTEHNDLLQDLSTREE